MLRSPFVRGLLLPLVSATAFFSTSRAQIQPLARIDGELLPILSCNRRGLELDENGKRRQTHDVNYQVRQGTGFADGYVEIKDIAADLDPLRNAAASERAKPDAIRFRYQAKIVADRSLSDCYALLTYVTEGSIGTHLISIGHLGANSAKSVEVELRTAVGVVGSLHVFSGGREVKSNQHPEAYDMRAYYAGLTKEIKGIAAVDLLKLEGAFPHTLSDDGRYVATIRLRDAKKWLMVYDLETVAVTCEVPVCERDDYVGDLRWISDHEIAFIAEDDFKDSRSEWQLHLLDTKTSKTRMLMDEVNAIVMSPRGKPEVLVLRYKGYLFLKYDVRTGKTFDMEEPDAGYYWFDADGRARVKQIDKTDTIRFEVRTKSDASWQDLDKVCKEKGLHFEVSGRDLLERVADVHSMGPDGDTLYLSTRSASDRFELVAFSLSEGVIKQTIAKHPKYDVTENDGGMARLLFTKKGTQLLGMVFEAQKPQVVWLDPHYAAVQKMVDAALPGHVNSPIDWTRDGSAFIYFSYSDQDPGTYYAVKPQGGSLIPLLQLADQLNGRTLAKTTPTEFVARDGQKLTGYVTRPTETTATLPPLLVEVHGGPMARDGWGFDASNQFFASRGYVVLQVNYRGSSGYGAKFQSAGLHTRLDTVVIDDIADCVRALIERKEVDPQRIAITGASFGGWATYISLAKYPELYRAGIAIAAVSHWRTTLRNDRWFFGNDWGYTFWRSLLHRQNFAEDEPFIDPLRRAPELKQPIYIMHGRNDGIIGMDEAETMMKALKHNPNVQLRLFNFATHTYWPFDDRVVLLNESARFLDRHLAPAATN